MKTKLRILLVTLCSTVATTVTFGQVLTWTNLSATSPGGGNYGRSTNWAGNNGSGGTTPISGTVGTFDGTVPGNLVIFSQDGIDGAGGGNPIGGSYGANGTSLNLTAGQVGSVNFISPVAASVGMGFNGIQVDSGAGQLILGDGTANQLVATLRPSSGNHAWINNSAHPIIINPNFQIQHGGGTTHTINFQGTGDFAITNNLRNNNNAPTATLQWDTTGTTVWTAGGVNDKFNDGGLANVVINAGTVIVRSPGLLPIVFGGSVQHNGTLLKFDAPPASQDTFVRAFGGAGPLQVNSGTWTFQSGASAFTGNLLLTGGQLNVNGAENPGVSGPLGVGGTISFNGGTLGFGVNNVFDYSPRFSTAAGQAYSFDTAGQNVTFTNAAGLASSGGTLTKLGSGTLTLAGPSTYSGLTTAGFGKLVFQGTKTGSGNITVADGAALGVFDTGTQVTPGTLTLGASAGAILEFNNVRSTTVPIISAGTISAGGPITININSGTLAPGSVYPLFACGGSVPPVSLGILNGFIGNLSTNGSTIQLNVTATAYRWTGNNNGNWDTSTANNWQQNGGAVVYGANGPGPAIFDDSASGNSSITINGPVSATLVTFNNINTNYSMVSSGANNLGGSTPLLQAGSGTTTLSGGANTYNGSTTISGGTLSVGALAHGGSASDIGAAGPGAANLVLDGGVFQYTGSAASIDRLFTVGTSGGTIDAAGSGELAFTNAGPLAYTGNGPRGLTLTGTNVATLAPAIANNGGATTVTKTGPGKWTLTGANSHSGVTTIASGILQIGEGGATGSPGSGNIVNNGSLVFNRTGSLTVSGAVSGTGSVTNDGTGTVILANNNTYSGGTTINAGTLQVGTGGATGSLNATAAITDNGMLIFNTTGQFTYTAGGLISGTGNVIVRGNNGLIKAIGNNTYTGWTLIDSGATFQPSEGNQGALVSSVVTNNGTLKLVRQDTATFYYSNNIYGSGRLLKDVNNNNDNDVTLLGANSYSNGTIIAGGTIILGDGVNAGKGSIIGNVVFTNSPTSQDVYRSLRFFRPVGDDVVFSGNITGPGGTGSGGTVANAGQVVQSGLDTVTLLGNNTYVGGTVINSGTLQVGNGGTTGSIGTGPVTDNGVLVWNRSNDATFGGIISGAGNLVKMGAGTLTLTGANTYAGLNTISNGTLLVNGTNSAGFTDVYGGTIGGTGTFSGSVSLAPGATLAPGASAGVVGTITLNGGLISTAGNLAFELNKSLSPSNDFVAVTGSLVNTGTGTLTVKNVGPAVAIGDKFTLFSQAVTGGSAITIVSPGFTAQNNLEVDGSITVTTVQPPPTIGFTYTASNSQLALSWPASWTGGVHLQSQTNALTKGLSTNWVTIPGTDATNSYTITVVKTNASVFYRLIGL